MFIRKYLSYPILLLVCIGCTSQTSSKPVNRDIYQFLNEGDICVIQETFQSRPLLHEGSSIRVFKALGQCEKRENINDLIGISQSVDINVVSIAIGTAVYTDDHLKYTTRKLGTGIFIYGIANKPIKSLVFHYPNGDVETQIDEVFFIAQVPDQTQPLSYTLK